MKEVYDNYEFLRRLTEKRFSDMVLADEAFTYAFDGLIQDDWRRIRAFKGKSSFRSYLGCVWCRLLEDFAIKKFGKVTPPLWIRNLGGIWIELFKLLCRHQYSINEAVEKMIGTGTWALDPVVLEKVAMEIKARVPRCGQKKGAAFSIDQSQYEDSFYSSYPDGCDGPDEILIDKERWIALNALANVFFKPSALHSGNEADEKQLIALIGAIRERIQLSEEEQLLLTAHFVDGESISTVGKRLGRNSNQIHGQFKRLMERIKSPLCSLLGVYL